MSSTHPLKAYRERQIPPLTQEQLAEMIGTSRASISRWETGERKPEPDEVRRINAATGILAAALRPDLAELFSAPDKRSGPGRPRSSPRARSRAA